MDSKGRPGVISAALAKHNQLLLSLLISKSCPMSAIGQDSADAEMANGCIYYHYVQMCHPCSATRDAKHNA